MSTSQDLSTHLARSLSAHHERVRVGKELAEAGR